MDNDNLWWLEYLSPREQLEVRHALNYVQIFNHGTSNHNLLVVVAKLADIITGLASVSSPLTEESLTSDAYREKVITVIKHQLDTMLMAPKIIY